MGIDAFSDHLVDKELAGAQSHYFLCNCQVELVQWIFIDEVSKEKYRLPILLELKTSKQANFIDFSLELPKFDPTVLPLKKMRFGQQLGKINDLPILLDLQVLFHEVDRRFQALNKAGAIPRYHIVTADVVADDHTAFFRLPVVEDALAVLHWQLRGFFPLFYCALDLYQMFQALLHLAEIAMDGQLDGLLVAIGSDSLDLALQG